MIARARFIGSLSGALLPLSLAACITDPSTDELGRQRTTHIELTSEFPLVVGEVRTRPTAFYADAANAPTGIPLNPTWVVRDQSVATLTGDGLVSAGTHPGSTYLVVSDGSLSDSTLVTVDADYFVWPDTMRLVPGAKQSVVVRARHEIFGVRGVLQTAWQSLDPLVATVTAEGRITATGAGQTSIVARRGDYSAVAIVNVTSYPRQLVFTDFGIGPGGVCALESDGTPWCWGQHQPVDATGTDRCGEYPAAAVRCSASPIHMSSMAFAQIVSSKAEGGPDGSAVGPYALTAAGLFYRLGQQGPVALGNGTQFRTALGGSPLCGVASDNHGFCWGYNANGEMGIGVTQPAAQVSTTPVEVNGGIQWKYFVHAESMCGLAVDGTAYCWGPNVNSEAGVGTGVLACASGCVNNPLPVKTDVKFTQLVAGAQEVCGLTSEHIVYCWGRNQTDNSGAVRVTNAPAFVALFGNRVICGVDAAGTASCLRFPNEPFRPAYQFVKLALPFPVTKIITGDKVHCASSATDGRLYCWGEGAVGAGASDASAPVSSPAEVWGQRPPT
jgi:hypothetical protein